jgi:hypothetical protein
MPEHRIVHEGNRLPWIPGENAQACPACRRKLSEGWSSLVDSGKEEGHATRDDRT